jgi:hypothetical protein
MYIPSETETDSDELKKKKTLVMNVRHFLNRTWKLNKETMKHELEKLQEELETNDYPPYYFKTSEPPERVYKALASEKPANAPKVALPPNVSTDSEKKGLKLEDAAIYHYRGDYPLFIPFYGDEVSAIGRTSFTDPVTAEPFGVGTYIVQFTNGAQETFMTRTSLIAYWNRPYPTNTPDEKTNLFLEKLKNPTTSTPFHDFHAKFVKVVQITAAQLALLHEKRVQRMDALGNAAMKTGKVALGATGYAARTALGATGLGARAVGLVPRAAGLVADATKIVANKAGLTNVAALADYTSLAAHGIGKGVDYVGKAAYNTARGTRKSPKQSEKEKPPDKPADTSWYSYLFS